MSNLVHRASEPEVVELVEEAIALTPPQFRIILADSYRLLALEGDITNIQKLLDAARAGEIEKLTRWTTQLASDIAKMKQALYHLDQKQQRLGQRQDDLEQRVKELENTRETQDYYPPPPPPPPPPSQPFNSHFESHQHKHFHINSDGFLLALWLAPMAILLLSAAVDSVRNLIRDSNSALPQIETERSRNFKQSSFQQVTQSDRRRVVVDINDAKAEVFDGQKLIKSYPISAGRQGMSTPVGTFRIQDKQQNPWYQSPITNAVYAPGANNPIGDSEALLRSADRWIEITETSTGKIGFHGTNAEHLIGQPVSLGCLRMRKQDLHELYNLVEIGTEVTIQQ